MWTWKKTEYRVLSQFANFSKHSEVLNSFKNELPVLNELRDKLDGCRQMVEAVYKVLAKREVRYSLEEYDSSQDSQQIRTPTEILDSKSQGTCLDLAVLFCGMCLRYELIPLLIVSGNHAWVAVSLTHWLHECKASDREKLFKDGLLTDEKKVAELCNLVEDEEAYIAIECTGFTQGSFSKSFDEAEKEGLNRLRNFSSKNGGFILDVLIAHDFYWRDLCHKRLKAETPKRLINNPLTNGENPLLKLYVRLGLIERKPDAQRRPFENTSPPEESPFNKPDDQYEFVREYKHEKFFEEVLKHKSSSRSQGKRLAIVGDPGGGKTTLLQRIAYWVLEEEQGLPIWIPLGEVNENWVKGRDETDEGWLYRYLSENWLRNVAGEPEKTPVELRQTFAKLLKSGQVWLLLDGADEMALKSPLTRVKEQLAKDWADSVRVVLSCRLNLWEVEKEALWEKFDIYRTLDFSYPEQVHQFINNWFGADNPNAKGLQDKLAEENQKRLQDLVKNPLRLALLCRIWKEGLSALPEAKADFYRLLVENHYKWKDDSTNEEFAIPEDRKKELNRALSELARDAIDREDFQFRLRESYVRKYLKDPNEKFSLFGWALKLGWLLDVGFPTEGERNRGEKVYAFFHPTFQEYFAATVNDNYGFFLPMEHRDRPVKDKNNPKKYERYRIFERQWKEVILLWLGRPEEEVSDKQKEEFIKALVEFEDGCGKFYGYRAYFLAAAGIAEFRDCNHNLANEIVEQIVKWSFGYCDDNEKTWTSYFSPIPYLAQAALLETDFSKAIDVIEQKIIPASINCWHNNGQVAQEAAKTLGVIGNNHPKAIKALVRLIANEGLRFLLVRSEAAKSLVKIGKGSEKAIKSLAELLPIMQDKQALMIVATTLEKIQPGSLVAKDYLIWLMDSNQDEYIRWETARQLLEIDSVNSIAVNIAVNTLHELKQSQKEWICKAASMVLEKGGVLNSGDDEPDSTGDISIPQKVFEQSKSLIELIELLGLSNPQLVREEASRIILQKVVSNYPETRAALIQQLYICNDVQTISVIIGILSKIAIGDEEVVKSLIYFIKNANLLSAAVPIGLSKILRDELFPLTVVNLKDYLQNKEHVWNTTRYEQIYEVVWFCSQKMSYPIFYQVWHQPDTD